MSNGSILSTVRAEQSTMSFPSDFYGPAMGGREGAEERFTFKLAFFDVSLSMGS